MSFSRHSNYNFYFKFLFWTVNDEIDGENAAGRPWIDLAHVDDQLQFGRVVGGQPQFVEHAGRKEQQFQEQQQELRPDTRHRA